ncbi:uncharacterized protein STEHIDRAFT_125881, partial [Stereum hirsutum FP-91666 SS1]
IFDYSSEEERKWWTPESSASPGIALAHGSVPAPAPDYAHDYAHVTALEHCEPKRYHHQSQYQYQHITLPQQSSNHMNTRRLSTLPTPPLPSRLRSHPLPCPHRRSRRPPRPRYRTTPSPPSRPSTNFTSQARRNSATPTA